MTVEEARVAVLPLLGFLRVETEPPDRDGWVDGQALGNPDADPLAALNSRFIAAGFGANRRAVAASLLLRFGWAAGFQIAAWLAYGVVVRVERFALKFSPSTLLQALWVQEGEVVTLADTGTGRAVLLDALRGFGEPLVASQHDWSRFSRHALWAMVVSSWGAQFAVTGARLGRRKAALDEAGAVFALDPEIAAAAPGQHEVAGTIRMAACQRRAACCLWLKGPARSFCASCPIPTPADRLERDRAWADRPTT